MQPNIYWAFTEEGTENTTIIQITVTIDNNNQVSIVADTENSDNHHANKNEVHKSYY